MRYIVISREEWNTLFAGKPLTLFRVPYDRVDEYKPGDTIYVRGLYQQETASVIVKRVVAFREGSGFILEVSDFCRFPDCCFRGKAKNGT